MPRKWTNAHEAEQKSVGDDRVRAILRELRLAFPDVESLERQGKRPIRIWLPA